MLTHRFSYADVIVCSVLLMVVTCFTFGLTFNHYAVQILTASNATLVVLIILAISLVAGVVLPALVLLRAAKRPGTGVAEHKAGKLVTGEEYGLPDTPVADQTFVASINAVLEYAKEFDSIADSQSVERNRRYVDALIEIRDREEEKNALVEGCAHDLQNPLTIIMGLIDFVLNNIEGKNDTELENIECLRYMHRNSVQLSGDLRTMLQFSASYDGAEDSGDFDVAVMVDECLSRTEDACAASRNTIHRVVTGKPVVTGGRTKIKMIIENLLTNAHKYTEDGEVTVSILVTSGCMIITVADTGIGIEENDIGRVFDVLHTHDARARGVGLGLSICRYWAESLGGKIRVTSEPLKGATFTVTIPVVAGK